MRPDRRPACPGRCAGAVVLSHQMPPTKRPGASRWSGSNWSLTRRIRSSAGTGPHTSTPALTAAGASTTTTLPPCRRARRAQPVDDARRPRSPGVPAQAGVQARRRRREPRSRDARSRRARGQPSAASSSRSSPRSSVARASPVTPVLAGGYVAPPRRRRRRGRRRRRRAGRAAVRGAAVDARPRCPRASTADGRRRRRRPVDLDRGRARPGRARRPATALRAPSAGVGDRTRHPAAGRPAAGAAGRSPR